MLVFFLSIALAQEQESKPVTSKDPLTADQVAVYRAVLADYNKGENSALNLANKTEPFRLNDFQDAKSCLKSANIQLAATHPSVVHRLSGAIALGPKMVFVDPDKQNETVKKNDPGNLIRSAIDDHQTLSDNELEKSVKQAFATGLFTFSEIAFNRQHTRAALWYSFSCGGLCGHGNTVVLKKVNGKWKMSRTCGGWIA
ncbi:MAG TPA: hypothetical protein VIK39_15105 [Candidatus Angelobacter sp.]